LKKTYVTRIKVNHPIFIQNQIIISMVFIVLNKLKAHIKKINKVLEGLESIPQEIENTNFSKILIIT